MKKDIQQLLQECLEGYDAGLTPEECLSPYPPRVRAELEPLFRQALSLRVAYASAPREEFKVQARERLLFAAGRDIKAALSAEPDPVFVSSTRQRLLNRAGAGAQEALRDVPPPRLPFWANARRHLLEAAASAPPKPAPRVPVGLRSAMSAAVVVIAVAIAGAGFILQGTPANDSSFAAQLDQIDRDLDTVEQLRANGQIVPPGLLDDLASRTSRLAEQYSEASPNAEIKEQLPDLIERQQTLLAQEDSLDASLAAAQERLNEADEHVASVAAAESTTVEPTETPIAAAIAPSPESSEEPADEPTTETSAESTPTEELAVPDVDIVTSSELEPGQIVSQYDADETSLNLRWWRVTTSTLSFPMPGSWEIMNVDTDDNNIAVLSSDQILVRTDIDGMLLIVNNQTGEVTTAVDGEQYTLRQAGPDGQVLSPDAVAEITAYVDNWASLYNMLLEVELAEPPATPEPEATATPEDDAGSDDNDDDDDE